MKKGIISLTLLFFSLAALIVTSGATVVIISNAVATSTLEQGTRTYYMAETGAENAILRLLRDPTYSGETILDPDGEIQISVTGQVIKTITSEARSGNLLRKIKVIIDYSDSVLKIISWEETS